MRYCLAVLGILFLAACAGGGSSGSKVSGASAQRAQSMVAQAPTLTDDEAMDYIAEVTEEKLTDVCRGRQTIRSQVACVREAVTRGFDTTGEAKRHCEVEASFEGALECVVVGSLGYGLALRADLDSAKEFDWRDTESSLKATVDELGSKLLRDCLKGDLIGIDGCVLDRLGTAFSLTGSQVAACTDAANTERSIDCLVRTFLLQSVEQAVAKMGPGGGQQA